MKIAMLIAVTATTFVLQVGQTFAQVSGGNYEEDLAEEAVKLDTYIKRLRLLLAKHGDAGVKSLENQVQFRISNERVPNAWVVKDPSSGQSTVFMTAEYRLLITYLADADVISFTTPGFIQCRQTYVDALFRALATNRQRSAFGSAPRRLLAPEVYLDAAPAGCREFKGKFPIEPKHRAARDVAVNTVIALGYLHELGHVALGHAGVSLASIEALPTNSMRLNEFVQLMRRSRVQEFQADDWAIDRFVDLSNNPLEALTNVLSTFYLAFGGFDCSLEAADSHPNGFQRFARQMTRLKARATASGKFPNNADVAKLIDDTTALASKAQQNLKCPI